MKTLIATACVVLCFLLGVPGVEAAEKAVMVSPASGSTLTSSTVNFQWTAGTGVSEHWLYVGTTIGGNELDDHNFGSGLSATVTGLPTNGIRIYARLWSLMGATWDFHDSTYIAYSATAGVAAAMTAPAPGSTLTASTVQFQWNGGTNVQQYWLYVGTSVGSNNLSDQDRGMSLSATVAGLPANGSTLYVRLWSLVGAAWQWNDYTYTATGAASSAPAQMTTPAPSSTLTSSTVTFQWTGGTGVSQYWLSVGTTAGGVQLYDQNRGTNLSATVTGLPTNGSTIYVRLRSLIGGSWQNNDYTYTATTTATGAPGEVTTPPPGSTLTASTVQVQWTGGTGVTDFWLYVGTTDGANNLYDQDRGTGLNATVTGLPTDGRTLYVKLWSLTSGTWLSRSYTYTAYTPGVTPAPAQMTTPAPGSTLAASTVQFQWTGGTSVSGYWLSVGTTAGGTQLYDQDRGTSLSATVTGLPTDGSTVYVRLRSLINGGWQNNDYTYTASSTSATPAPAEMTTPAPGSTLSASTVQFRWTGGTAVTQMWLYVGRAVGLNDLFDQDRGTNLTATVPGLPTNGSTVYVRLWSLTNGNWLSRDYTYTATNGSATGAPAQLTTPAPGSTLTSSTVQFQWTGGTGVSDYWLYVGTTQGLNDLSDQDRGMNLNATVAGLPTNGSTVYVRLFSLVNGTWVFNDYTYTAAH